MRGDGERMKRALVTGGGGFIGGAIARQLLADGVSVSVVGRGVYPALESLGVECLRGDIRDHDFLTRAFTGHDTIFHAAAKAGIWGPLKEYEATNVTGTLNVIRACRENQIPRLVYTSTPSVVFNGEDIEGADETLPYATRTLCHYAATKIQAEKEVLKANALNLRTTAIRPHLVWGPGDNHLIPRLVERGRSGRLRIIGDGRNRVDIAYIENVVSAHILAARNLVSEKASAAGEAFFIGQENPVCLWEWVNLLFARLDMAPVTRKVPFTIGKAMGYFLEKIHGLLLPGKEPVMTRFIAHQLARSHWFSHEKANRLLGYRQLVSTEAGMDRLVASIRSRKSV